MLVPLLLSRIQLPDKLLDKQVPSGKIEGQVVEQGSGQGVAGWLVNAKSTVPGSYWKTISDAQGHYAFTGLAEGDYTVFVKRDRADASRHVTLARANAVAADIDLKLPGSSVVSGHISSPDGEPAAAVWVELWSFANVDGVLRFLHNAHAETDNRGDYRMDGLPMGKYYVSAGRGKLTVRQLRPKAANTRADPITSEVLTYYPGVSSPEGMVPVTLLPGTEMSGIDFKMIRTATHCANAFLEIRSPTVISVAHKFNGATIRLGDGGTPTGGAIQICGLAPDSYHMIANLIPASPGNFSTYSETEFTIGHEDVNLGTVRPGPTIPVPGRLHLAGSKVEEEKPTGITVEAVPYDGSFYGEETTAEVEPSGNFILPHLYARLYTLSVSNIPKSYYLKGATIRGRDALSEPFRAGDGELEITLANDGSSVNGAVVDSDDRPLADSRVVLVPDPLPTSLLRGQITTTYTDQNGQFKVLTVAPGKYFIYATTDTGFKDEEDPEIVSRHTRNAKEITLEPKRGIEVKLIVE